MSSIKLYYTIVIVASRMVRTCDSHEVHLRGFFKTKYEKLE